MTRPTHAPHAPGARDADPAPPAPAECHLRLYVAGDLPNSVQARENLRRLRESLPPGHRTEVVDLLEDPGRALADGVLVTPTLVRVSPAPRRMVVGTLADASSVLHGLGLPGGGRG